MELLCIDPSASKQIITGILSLEACMGSSSSTGPSPTCLLLRLRAIAGDFFTRYSSAVVETPLPGMRKSHKLASYFVECRLQRCGRNWDDLLLAHVRCFRIHFLNSFPSSYSTVHWGGTDNCEASVVVRVELSVSFIACLIARNGLASKGFCCVFESLVYKKNCPCHNNFLDFFILQKKYMIEHLLHYRTFCRSTMEETHF